MCIAVKWAGRKIYFMEKNAVLPVMARDGAIVWVRWGRKLHEFGKLPNGKRLWYSELKNNKFDQFFPKLVRIVVDGFLERDKQDDLRWNSIIKGQCIQGVLLKVANEYRVYIVSFGCRNNIQGEFEIWPHILMTAL